MIQTLKKLLRLFMSDEPPNIHCLLPRIVDNLNIFNWTNGILGRDLATTSLCFLDSLEHCKANRLPKHKFLIALFTLYLDKKTYKIGIIVDRHPAETIDIETKDASPPLPTMDSTDVGLYGTLRLVKRLDPHSVVISFPIDGDTISFGP